jgi:hypothetical protein
MVARRQQADGRSFMLPESLPRRAMPRSTRRRGRCCTGTAWWCRRLLSRETNACPWRELIRVYRRLEARGEIRAADSSRA